MRASACAKHSIYDLAARNSNQGTGGVLEVAEGIALCYNGCEPVPRPFFYRSEDVQMPPGWSINKDAVAGERRRGHVRSTLRLTLNSII